MGKKGKYNRKEEEDEPEKKKNMITEQQLMDKSHMDRTEFIPILMTQSLYYPYIFDQISQAALKKIVTDFNYLLYIDFKNFWATVLYSPSLKNCLSSCLSFLHRRWMNNYISSKESEDKFEQDQQNLTGYKQISDYPAFEYTQGILQALLLIYHRIVSFNYEDKDLSQLYKIGEQISKKYILDLPKIYELVQIYGATNPTTVKYIVKMFSNTVPSFYQGLTTTVFPILFKKIEQVLRQLKVLTEREEYGIKYSYKRLATESTSQGEQQLKKKMRILMELVGFINIIKNTMIYFPEDCADHCYFNSQIQFLYENIFLQLQAAYKTWDYQTQDIKILNIINYILQSIIQYFVQYFDRCENVILIGTKKVSAIDAYINSLERIFKQFGKRTTMPRKNQERNLLMYKIIQKKFDLQKMVQSLYDDEISNQNQNFNLEFLKDFIIALDNELEEAKSIAQQQQHREENSGDETQNEELGHKNQQNSNNAEDTEKRIQATQQIQQTEKQEEIDFSNLQMMVPKRMRSEDYYTKLYADFNSKCYKGEYQDDYDDAVDFNKRPVFYDEQSSNSESEEEVKKNLVSNNNKLSHVQQIHLVKRVSKQQATNKPKYSRVEDSKFSQQHQSRPQYTEKRYEEKKEQGDRQENKKAKYVQKPKQSQLKQESNFLQQIGEVRTDDRNDVEQRVRQQLDEPRGGQGHKKSSKSYNYKPKDGKHDNFDKGRNTNKTKDHGNQFQSNKRYREKH